jgi:galactose mutarotase-like enzyme
MRTTVVTTKWLGQPAITFETERLRLITVPGMGAKIVSIFDKAEGREWVLPPANRPFQPVSYGAVFVDQDMSGWDEMFPTINECHYPLASPYTGKKLPDHGEVWALPWAVSNQTENSAEVQVSGQALPYRLSRKVEFVTDAKVRFTYTVDNLSDVDIVGFWTAHPQFVVNTLTRIVLPPEVTTVVNVVGESHWGEVGRLYGWHESISHNGESFRLDQVRDPSHRDCRKFYLPPEQSVSWAALQNPTDSSWLRLSWDPAIVSYLGIWVDEGVYGPVSTVALEPSTGYFDSLEWAVANQRVPTIPAHGSLSWDLDVECGAGVL